MAGGWARDGAEQEQMDATVTDAVKRAREKLPSGDSLEECEECESEIPAARREALPGYAQVRQRRRSLSKKCISRKAGTVRTLKQRAGARGALYYVFGFANSDGDDHPDRPGRNLSLSKSRQHRTAALRLHRRDRGINRVCDGGAEDPAHCCLPSVAAAMAQDSVTLHGWVYDIKSGGVNVYDEERKEFVPVGEHYADAQSES